MFAPRYLYPFALLAASAASSLYAGTPASDEAPGSSSAVENRAAAAAANTVLWRVGLVDGANAEFTKTSDANMPATYSIGSGWAQQTTWPEWPSVPPKNAPWTTAISYTLSAVPANGVLFSFKAVTATIEVPEIAVYSNYNPCGIIQVGGAKSPGFGPAQQYTRTFTRPYQIYVPPTTLHTGTNVLQIKGLGHPYNRASTTYLDLAIDYMQLESLASPATEPIHGKMAHVGISDGNFNMTTAYTAMQQAECEWMGVAYSGNPTRAAFFNDLVNAQPDRLAWLQKQRDLNMSVILDGWNCSHTHDTDIVNGQLPTNAQSYLNGLFSSYGPLVQFYEICNEPTQSITQASYQYCLADARYVNSIKPSTVTLTPPGYTFGGGSGDPVNWDSVDSNRAALDALCGAYAGHAFSNSYGYDKGSLTENIDAHGTFVNGNPVVSNGWDKPFVVTECGSPTTNYENFTQCCTNQATQKYSSTLDRDLRAHVAWADYFCAADMWNNGTAYDYLTGTPTDTSTWGAAPANSAAGDLDSRVKALRRIALAYGTHGAPLAYTWQNVGTSLPLVYFRAVDTSKLAPLAGSGAHASKILLSFVNFDLLNANTISVNVTMPVAGTYTGVSYNAASTYMAARQVINGLSASPTLSLTVNLGPGESVEYLLDRPQ